VAVEGKKQGATKKSQNTQAGRLLVCKVELQRQFAMVSEGESLNLANNSPADNAGAVGGPCPTEVAIRDNKKDNELIAMKENPLADTLTDSLDKKYRATYSELKARASEYQSTWKSVRSAAKLVWTDKNPTLLNFFVDDDAERKSI